MPDAANDLVAQAVAGNEDALATLLEDCAPEVARRIGAKVPRRQRAHIEIEDLMQVTFMEVFLRIGRFEDRGRAAFAAWVMRVAENNLRDAIRYMDRDKRPPPQARLCSVGGDSFVSLLDLVGFTSTTPSRTVASEEARRLIETAIEQLPADYATALRLYDLGGQTIAAVAEAMHRSPGAVHVLRARAHDRLRECLGTGSQILSR